MLAFTAGGIALPLAGCSGDSDSGPEPTDSDSSDGSDGGDGSDGSDESTDENGSDESDDSDSGPEQVQAAVGDLVEGDQLHLVVEGIERTTSLGQFSQPDAGNEFVVVSLALKNVSDDYVSVSNLLQTRLRDAEDFQYDQTFAGGGGNTFNAGQFAPGEVERGTITFEVPEDASGLQLVFDLDASIIGGIDRARINLGEQADSVAELEQDLGIDVYGTGEEIGYQDVAVTVNGTRTESSLGQYSQPDEGNEFVIVDISITNNTGEERSFSTILQMMLKDGEGYTYQESLTATSSLDRSFDEGTPLSDGETRRGELAYELAEGTAPLYWVFEFSVFAGGDKTFWEVRG
ncbi:hypothetical protein C464_06100 [Halorubrum coriense DSM 10284]|uniref:DUF4352 domain-containing protein n=1 Tax=Halorubrum coriense DSM 10284 TaxID=1227466 RepID=M0EMK5_9EURY|nr:hypothetical protein C464_06100 [Halorubrum coriense DSM 10284]